MVLCVLIPRFELIAACSGDWQLLRGAVALAPQGDAGQVIGEPSRAAETFGVVAGMWLAEALARCPEIKLIPPDPMRAATLWRQTLKCLEDIGAEVESEHAGEAFFRTEGLLPMHGGMDGLLGAVQRGVGRRRALGAAVQLAVAPTRFAARLAAIQGESAVAQERYPGRTGTDPKAPVIGADELDGFLAPLPVTALLFEPGIETSLARDLQRLGIATLGDLAAIPAAQIADRFGHPGMRARDLAGGCDEPLRPRHASQTLVQTLELPDSVDGSQLDRALEILIDRFLAMPERQGRMLRALILSATFAGGGSWRREVALNRPSGAADTLRLALAPHLDALPSPVSSLTLEALSLGPAVAEQPSLDAGPEHRRRARLAEAIRQTRANAGPDSLLRILTLDPNARLPERRLTLTPYEPPQ